MKKRLIAVALCPALTGCASIIDGTTQEMTFNSSPQGADCVLERDGKMLARLTTPNTITIKKTKHDIKVSCTKDGYEPTIAMIKSEVEGSTWGNIILGGGIGWAIDSARGADNKYDEYVNITLAQDGSVRVGETATPAPLAGDTIVEDEDGQEKAEALSPADAPDGRADPDNGDRPST